MKVIVKTIPLFFILSMLFFGCSNPTGGIDPDSGTEAKITISLGGDEFDRAGFAGDGIAEWNDISLVLELTPVSSGKIIKVPEYTSTASSSTAQASVTSGFWNITLKGYWPTVNDLYAIGHTPSGGVEIKANQNNPVKISMERPGGPFTVDFDLNGGSGTIPSLTNKGLLPDAESMKSGYTFLYWARNPSGGGTTFNAGTSYAPDGVNLTLYAQWAKNLSFSFVDPAAILTPIVIPVYDESYVTFNITIPELDPAEMVTLDLDVNSYGLSLTGSTTVTGLSPISITLSYDGSTEFTETGPVSLGLNVLESGYHVTGSPTVTVEIFDGQAATRAIPIDSNNIKFFNIFMTDLPTKATGLVLHYKLEEDIIASDLRTDLPGSNNWVAMGDSTTSFTGSFDGNDHTITGLIIDVASDYQGMFGYISRNGSDTTTGVVKKLGLVGGSVTGNNNLGGVAGANDGGTVQNCYNTGYVEGDDYIGGIVGFNKNGNVENCYTTGSEIGYSYVGGVMGQNYDGMLANCYSMSIILGTGAYIGGVVGDSYGVAITRNCYATGDITALNGAGGVSGYSRASVQNCVALSPTLTRTMAGNIFARVAFAFGGTVSASYARSDMQFIDNIPPATFTPNNPVVSNANDAHGEDLAVDNTVPLNSIFSPANGWDPIIWNIPSENFNSGVNALPTLRNMPSGIQAPILP